jgi:membrane associated rhomboid family serine protease
MKDNLARPGVPWVTVTLIALNVIAFAWLAFQPADKASTTELARAGVSERDEMTLEYGAIPYRITHPDSECGVAEAGATQAVICEGAPRPDAFQEEGFPDDLDMKPWWLTLVTSMFITTGLLALAVNMLALWIFGNTIESAMGRWKFLLFYLASGVVALYAQALLDSDATIPLIGSSGAVAGVLGAYAVRYAGARVLTFVITIPLVFTFIEVPALIIIAIWMGLQFLPAFEQIAALDLGTEDGIAYVGHIASFVFGMAMIGLLVRRDGRAPELEG